MDPITFEVMRSSFEYTCDRMSRVLRRAAFSPLIVDMVDFSNAIFDADGDLLGQAANCPVHVGAMHFSTRASIDRFGPGGLREGDVVVLNDPYHGGTHTNDVTMTAPVFWAGELIGYAVSRAHWTDVGGGGAGGQAFGTHIAAEGLRIPPMKLVDGGVLNDDLVAIMRCSSRVPQHVDGDLRAQLGALRAAEQELHRLAERYGLATLAEAMREVQDYTERMTRAAVERIPDGVYRAQEYTDTDGVSPEPVRLQVALTVAGDQISVDFAGTDPTVAGSVNSPLANTHSCVYYALKFFLQPDAPANAGMYRAIDISVPEGTWLNCAWPAPTIGCTTVAASKVGAAIWQAIAQAIPERAIAPTNAEINWFVAGVEEAGGGQAIYSELPAGGWGGTPFGDGMNVTMDPLGNCTNLPVEVGELLFPVTYESLELRPDSGGAGERRGGLGQRFQVRWDGRAAVSMGSSRTRAGSPGVGGGAASPPQRLVKVAAGGEEQVIGGIDAAGEWVPCVLSSHPFDAGESFRIESTGGGGWGAPLTRDPALVLEDVRDGYVSAAAARDTYGVVLDGAAVDAAATAAARQLLRQGPSDARS